MKGIHLLKKYFIPGEHNDHKPHILRTEVVMFFFAVILLVEMIFLLQVEMLHSRKGYFAQVLPSVIAGLANDNRQIDKLPRLQTSEVLQKAAQMKADDMAQKGYFAHNSPEGVTPWYWIDRAGYKYDYAGENLAVDFIDSSDVSKAWMDSPTHRKNILNANFTEIGIATANGVYEGRETTFIVQIFGRPAKKVEEQESIATVSAQKNSRGGIQPFATPKEHKEATLNQAIEVEGEVSGAFTQSNEVAQVDSAIAPIDASFIKKAMTMPRLMNMYLYGVLLTIVSLALMLKVFIRIKIQHSQLIVNGVMLLIIMATALVVNQKIVLAYGNIM